MTELHDQVPSFEGDAAGAHTFEVLTAVEVAFVLGRDIGVLGQLVPGGGVETFVVD